MLYERQAETHNGKVGEMKVCLTPLDTTKTIFIRRH